MEEGCAKWMTNVRNERGKILATDLTDSESTRFPSACGKWTGKTFWDKTKRNLLSSTWTEPVSKAASKAATSGLPHF